MNKELYTAAIVNVVAYFNQVSQEVVKALPTKMRWNIKKNLTKFIPIAKEFDEFRNELVKELQEEWFTDERSEEFETEEGEKQRRIKEEYMPDYDKAVQEVNKKLEEILGEKREVEIALIDLDGFVETMPDDSPVTFEDLDILSVFTEEA